MKLTAKDLYDLNIIDKIIKEPKKITNENFKKITENIKKEIQSEIAKMFSLTKDEIVNDRYQKFRNIKCLKEIGEEENVIKK